MPELSSQSTTPESFDPRVIEARLGALTGSAAEPPPERHEPPDLLEQFLAEPGLTWLGSRQVGENNSQTVLEYHRIRLLSGQTRAVLHLSFRPDLPTEPVIEANLLDADGRTRVTHSTKFGARIEITLVPTDSEPSTVCLEAICTTRPMNSADENNLKCQ